MGFPAISTPRDWPTLGKVAERRWERAAPDDITTD